MLENEFAKALHLLRHFSSEQLLNSKLSVFNLLQELKNEKKNASNEVRRALYYYSISDKTKRARISRIDEILLPATSSRLNSEVNDVFPEIRISSLNRVKLFKKERERLTKVSGDHSLRVRHHAKLLSVLYVEIKRVENQYAQLNNTDLVRKFFEMRDIDVADVVLSDAKRYYEVFRKEGI